MKFRSAFQTADDVGTVASGGGYSFVFFRQASLNDFLCAANRQHVNRKCSMDSSSVPQSHTED